MPLLSDFNKDVIRAYGVVNPDMIGLHDIAKRAIFVIDRERRRPPQGSARGRAQRARLRQGQGRARRAVAGARVSSVSQSSWPTPRSPRRSVRSRTISRPSGRCSGRSSSRTTRSTWRRRSSTGEDFYRDAHRRIFDCMAALSERSHAIDFVTLKEELSRSGKLDDVGGPAYVASLADGVPRATNVEYYAKIVKEKATLRNLIYAANKIVADAYGAEQESDLILDEAESVDLRRRRRPAEGRLRRDARSGQGELPEDRAALRAEAAHHRRADRLRRHRRHDARPAAGRPRHRRGAPVDGEDQPRAQHRAVRGGAAGSHGRLLQPGNVEGVAVPAPAHVGGAHRQPPADERRHRPEGLRPHRARARDAEQHAAAHRRHRRHRRDGDARQVAAPEVRARPATCWSWTTSS